MPFDQLTFAAWREEAPEGRVLAPEAGRRGEPLRARRLGGADAEDRRAPVGGKRPAPAAACAGRRRRAPAARPARIRSRVSPVRRRPRQLGGGADRDRAGAGRSIDARLQTAGGRPRGRVRGEGRRVALPPRRHGDRQRMGLFRCRRRRSFQRTQLVRLPFLEEYWFDWKTYHPSTDVARHTSDMTNGKAGRAGTGTRRSTTGRTRRRSVAATSRSGAASRRPRGGGAGARLRDRSGVGAAGARRDRARRGRPVCADAGPGPPANRQNAKPSAPRTRSV